jgi:putative nucleotidyltransferase with HDIG domain
MSEEVDSTSGKRRATTGQQRTIAEQRRTIAEQQRTIAEQQRTIAEQQRIIDEHVSTITLKDRLYCEADAMLESVLRLLIRAVELRDPYTRGHSERVTRLSLKLANYGSLSFEEREIKNLRYGALLHDVGKIGIGDYVLHKPTLLTEAEFILIKQHTLLGAKLLEPLNLDPTIFAVVLSHHENYDGSGYPHGLKGEEIPRVARIVRIADAYEALTSDRPYRKALDRNQAMEVLWREEHLYDSFLLQQFTELIAAED